LQIQDIPNISAFWDFFSPFWSLKRNECMDDPCCDSLRERKQSEDIEKLVNATIVDTKEISKCFTPMENKI
jgi:hypothetical protein